MSPTTGLPDAGWKLELEGESEELRGLAKMFAQPEATAAVRISLDDDGRWYLRSPEFEALKDAGKVRERGLLWVTRLNGFGTLKFGWSRPVVLGSMSQVTAQGGQGVFVSPEPGVLSWARPALLTYIGEPIPRFLAKIPGPDAGSLPLPPVEQWVALADRYSPEVDDALLLLTLAVPAEDWRLLYVVFEIVEDLVGKRNMPNLGVSKAQIERFKRTANSRRALGTKARHGHRGHVPPRRPMTFMEARVLIRRLLLAALKYLADLG